jgi:hypothetical protein
VGEKFILNSKFILIDLIEYLVLLNIEVRETNVGIFIKLIKSFSRVDKIENTLNILIVSKFLLTFESIWFIYEKPNLVGVYEYISPGVNRKFLNFEVVVRSKLYNND